ncbi:MAG TPA: sulfur carrier protein ThiS [Planctomycetota bacterium]|nr:sulfur carrier protein ThiS [Planctomycetota bacterium]
MVEITLNGVARDVREGTTLADLVDGLALPPEQVAVELNRALVRQGERESRRLEPGDQVELVTLVGGG